MKIVTWNCNGAFRNKYHLFDSLDLDVLIIQECENPKLSTKKYQNWACNYLWKGTNKNKGIGVFVKNQNILKLLDWSDKNTNYKNESLELFLPVKINEIILLAVWTKKANSEVFGYIGQFWKYLNLHKEKFKNEKIVIAGDFNSNKNWDKWDRWWNHTDCVDELKELNIESLYHIQSKEAQGKETIATFYLQRKKEKAYHIDYVFLSQKLINKDTTIKIENQSIWLENSDHMPIFFNI